MEHLNQNIRVAIDADNPSVTREESKCIKCGQWPECVMILLALIITTI